MILDLIRTFSQRSLITSRPLREEWIKSGLMNTKVLGVNVKTLLYQVPGGMLIKPCITA